MARKTAQPSKPQAGSSGDVAQVAALPYLVNEHGLNVLMITSRGRGRWVLPKGHLETGLSAMQTVALEADEEAGIAGALDADPIGTYTYRKFDDPKQRLYVVSVYPMRVERMAHTWQEDHERRRLWFPCDVAATLVEEDGLRQIIREFGALMGAHKHPARNANGRADTPYPSYAMATTSISSMPPGVRNFTTSPS